MEELISEPKRTQKEKKAVVAPESRQEMLTEEIRAFTSSKHLKKTKMEHFPAEELASRIMMWIGRIYG